MAKKKKRFNKRMILSLISIILSFVFAVFLLVVNVLPTKYYLILLGVIIVFNFIICMINKNNKKVGIKIITIIYILLYLMGLYYLFITYSTLNSFQNKNKIETYLVVTLKENNYKIDDLSNKYIGFYKDKNVDEIKTELKKVVSYKSKTYKDTSILSALDDKTISAMVVEQAYYDMMTTDKDTSKYEVIYKIEIKTRLKEVVKEVNVTNSPFIIYISGIDTYGSIANVSRSDVNILLVVNPKTKEVLLINTPRDYYVKLDDTNSYDKLTHAGITGIESSINTLQNLYDIDINYYFKVNFSSVVDIVNALGGVEVYSQYKFTTYNGYNIQKGYNSLNGTEALSFARTRKNFSEGDRVRGMNQMAVIKAIIQKVTSPDILTKYTSLLNSINGRFQTNLSTENMSKLVKMQLNDMAKWNINSVSVSGEGSYEYGYYYPHQKLYVMLQDKKDIDKVKAYIESVMNDDDLGDVTEIIDSDVYTPIYTKEETIITKEDTVITKEDTIITKEDGETTEESLPDTSELDPLLPHETEE